MFLKDKLRGGVQIPLAPGNWGLQLGGLGRWISCVKLSLVSGEPRFALIKNKEKNTEGACMTSFQRVLLLVGAVAGACGDRRLLRSATVSGQA